MGRGPNREARAHFGLFGPGLLVDNMGRAGPHGNQSPGYLGPLWAHEELIVPG
jgi:hypothetical protein